MAKLVVDAMKVHGTQFLRQTVPEHIEKNSDGKLIVQWKDSKNGGTHRELFDTVIMATGNFM